MIIRYLLTPPPNPVLKINLSGTYTQVSYRRPHVLILDEPTNNLDLEAVAALADCVESFKGVSCAFLMCFSSYCCYYKCMAKHSIAMLACSLGHAIQEKNCARSVFSFFLTHAFRTQR